MMQIVESMEIRCVDCVYHSLDYVCEHWCNATERPRRIPLHDAYKKAPCTKGRISNYETN